MKIRQLAQAYLDGYLTEKNIKYLKETNQLQDVTPKLLTRARQLFAKCKTKDIDELVRIATLICTTENPPKEKNISVSCINLFRQFYKAGRIT